MTEPRSLKIKIDNLRKLKPITKNQEQFFHKYHQSDLLLLHGCPGTGKSYISLYKAFKDVLEGNYHSVIILRSAVPSRDIGYLPGDEEEKSRVYQFPYMEICDSLFTTRNAYERLIEQDKLIFSLTSYLRGITFENRIIIVDEIQNMNYQELSTIITRIGKHSKLILTGDIRQNDLLYKKNDQSGLPRFLSVLNKMDMLKQIEFGVDDIVRSDLVKQFIIAEMNANV